ncbi:MAG: hypothetical protein NTU85_01455 [Candidatus Kaiserbacteria bacterium]|nr:hypothetical protein [Candidatus Kaiserbacteria bacterium]
MNNFQTISRPRRTAVNGLAVVGFFALVVAGMWLAIYSTRFVPIIVNRTGAAVVYVGSVFASTFKNSAPTVSTTMPSVIYFGEASSTDSTIATSTPVKTTSISKQYWTPGTSITIADGPAIQNYYGSPDLAIIIETIGYSSGNAIVSATTIPVNTPIAVKFLVKNVGTNVSGQWAMNISGSNSANKSFTQASLAPGQPSEYIVHFANNTPGTHTITITIDPNRQLQSPESNTNNNSISATVTTL